MLLHKLTRFVPSSVEDKLEKQHCHLLATHHSTTTVAGRQAGRLTLPHCQFLSVSVINYCYVYGSGSGSGSSSCPFFGFDFYLVQGIGSTGFLTQITQINSAVQQFQ